MHKSFLMQISIAPHQNEHSRAHQIPVILGKRNPVVGKRNPVAVEKKRNHWRENTKRRNFVIGTKKPNP